MLISLIKKLSVGDILKVFYESNINHEHGCFEFLITNINDINYNASCYYNIEFVGIILGMENNHNFSCVNEKGYIEFSYKKKLNKPKSYTKDVNISFFSEHELHRIIYPEFDDIYIYPISCNF